MLRFSKGSPLHEGRVGIFPGAFNPPTLAHTALARAALEQHRLDQVVFLLPEQFPHKAYEGAPFDERVAMLQAAVGDDTALAIASLDRGLFIDIARAFREECGPGAELFLLCGKDAAERIVNWDYQDRPPFREQLEEFQMLVASRDGEYAPPSDCARRIALIELPASWDACSASGVREAVAKGRPWRPWVAQGVADLIEKHRLYR